MSLEEKNERDMQDIAFSSHPGHGDPRRTVAEHDANKRGNTGARNQDGLSGALKYTPTPSD